MWIAEPQRPGDEPALPAERPEPRDVGDAGEPADDGDVAPVRVAERRRRLARQPAPDRLRRVAPALDPALGDARHGPVLLPRLRPRRRRRRRSRGGPGSVRSGPTRIRPLRSVGGAGRLRRRPRRTTSTRIPAAHSVGPGRDPLRSPPPAISTVTERSSIADDPRLRSGRSPPSRSSWRLRRRRAIRRVGRQDPVQRLDEQDPGVGRVDRAEVAAERVAGDLAERAGQLDARSGRRRRGRTSSTRARRSGSCSRSAASKAIRIRRRISVASSIDFRPGATAAQSSWPKYE